MSTATSRLGAALCATVLLAAPPLPAAGGPPTGAPRGAHNEKLVGNWRLVSFTWKVLATGSTYEGFGTGASGFLTYGRDGRVLVLVVGKGRPKPADWSRVTPEQSLELLKTVIAFGGTYEFDGKTVTIQVDMSSNETWTGMRLVRTLTLDGNRLTLSTPPTMGADGNEGIAVTTFERSE